MRLSVSGNEDTMTRTLLPSVIEPLLEHLVEHGPLVVAFLVIVLVWRLVRIIRRS